MKKSKMYILLAEYRVFMYVNFVGGTGNML